MEHKSWLWKRKSTEKVVVAADQANLSVAVNEGESLLTDKAELERDLKFLTEKLSSTLSDSCAKDEIVRKHTKMVQEAVEGRQKAEAEALALKQEVDKAVKQRLSGEVKLNHLDAALKECVQQLHFVREEQEHRIHDVVVKASKEFESTRALQEDKLAETGKRLAKLGAENSQLSKALLAKEKVIEDLNESSHRAEMELSALMTRMESVEKENSTLKYEIRVSEKELEIRNEEREFNRRTADVAHNKHLESVKKIAKLESECQRLRILVRKRLPGPAALAKMKNEVEILGRDPSEGRRRYSKSSSMDLSMDASDTPGKKINFLSQQLCIMEEENRALKESLNKKTNELQLSRVMHTRTASKLSQVEAQLEDSSKSQATAVPTRYLPTEIDHSVASASDLGSEDKASCAESWASALVSELEHFRNRKQARTPPSKIVGISGINLMDDFVEMEKLAVVSATENPLASAEHNAAGSPLGNISGGYLESASIRVSDCQSDHFGWLDDIVKLVLEQIRLSQRSREEILEDIRVALDCTNRRNPTESPGTRGSSNHLDSPDLHPINGSISWKSPCKSSPAVSFDRSSENNFLSAKKHLQSNLGVWVQKIAEIVEAINLPSPNYDTREALSGKDDRLLPYKTSETSTGYVMRVFQWKTCELSAVLQRFVQTCYDLLNGKEGVEKFGEDLTSSLEWIMNHCFSLQDVSSMRDAVKKHLDWDEGRSENELEVGMVNPFTEGDKHLPKEQLSYLHKVSTWSVHNNFSQTEEAQSHARDEVIKLKGEVERLGSTKKALEGRLETEIDKNGSLTTQLHESGTTIQNLKTEVEALKQSRGKIEDQIENHKMMKENLDRRLADAVVELNETRLQFSCLEKELEDKHNSCEELEAACLDLQLQLESTKTDTTKFDVEQVEKQLQTDWEISAASEKLAECQETILNLGKQLKSLASSRDAALLDKVISSHMDTNATMNNLSKNDHKRISLLDKMLAEDEGETGNLGSHKTKEFKSSSTPGLHDETSPPKKLLNGNAIKQDYEPPFNSLAIVPYNKKNGGRGLIKKLLWRKKKGKKAHFPYVA